MFFFFISAFSSVADPDPGSGAFLTPGFGIRTGFFPDPGSQDHIFKSFLTIFLVKSFLSLWKLAKIFFLQHFKTKIIYNFVKFVATLKGMTTYFFFASLFCYCFESGIRDPGSGMGKNQDPGSAINIPDPPHWLLDWFGRLNGGRNYWFSRMVGTW